jgi:hypothetical protein
VGGPFAVLTPAEAAVLLAIARRVVPSGAHFPSPERVRVAERVDAFLAMSHPGVQSDVKRLASLFDSPLLGLVLDGSPFRFTTASADRQDGRLTAWATSRLSLRRTGYRALKRLVCSTYYSSPSTWSAVGYPGPPSLGEASHPPAEPQRAGHRRRHAPPAPPAQLPKAEPAGQPRELDPMATHGPRSEHG